VSRLQDLPITDRLLVVAALLAQMGDDAVISDAELVAINPDTTIEVERLVRGLRLSLRRDAAGGER